MLKYEDDLTRAFPKRLVCVETVVSIYQQWSNNKTGNRRIGVYINMWSEGKSIFR